MLIRPSKKNIKAILEKVRDTIKTRKGASADELIKTLNPIIRGWTNYHQHVVSKRIFSYVDNQIFNSIWRWCCRKHPNKGRRWVKRKYFASNDNQSWVFSATYTNHDGERKPINLFKTEYVPIRRHIKIRAAATPYDQAYQAYFAARAKRNKSSDYKGSPHSGIIGTNTPNTHHLNRWVTKKWLYKGLSRVRRKSQARFLGEQRLLPTVVYPTVRI